MSKCKRKGCGKTIPAKQHYAAQSRGHEEASYCSAKCRIAQNRKNLREAKKKRE